MVNKTLEQVALVILNLNRKTSATKFTSSILTQLRSKKQLSPRQIKTLITIFEETISGRDIRNDTTYSEIF